MPLSHKSLIAQARRQLRRIEEDEPRFRKAMEAEDMSKEGQTKMMIWFNKIVERQRKYLRDLEESK